MSQPDPSPPPSGALPPLPPLADPPGWAPIPGPPPGPQNPDSPPPGEAQESPVNGEPGPGPGDSGKGPTRGSTALSRITREGLSDAIGAAFYGLGHGLNSATSEGDDDDIWLPTDDEVEGVGQPGARLVGRRIPDLPGDQASDIGDLVSLMIPLAVWGVRGLATWLPRVAKKRRGNVVQGSVVAPQPDGQ